MVGALCIATTASEYARARPTVADPNARPSGFRHRCVPNGRCLMSPASGLMTARPSRQRRSSSECQRKSESASAILCGTCEVAGMPGEESTSVLDLIQGEWETREIYLAGG